jgi:Bacterial archaeo-eukaryotic release factor family 3
MCRRTEMSVYHCPLCPLIFQYRTEVEWHMREEHRSRAEEEANLRAELASAGKLSWARLDSLRSSISGPAVSLLLATTPATSMTVLDIARLRQLADRSRRRLRAEPQGGTSVSVVERRLSRAVAAAEASPTDRGLAVLVNCDQMAVVNLPHEPRDRAAVDRAFSTRDLEYALRRFPAYRTVLLGHHPRIFEGRGRNLSEIETSYPEARGLSLDFLRRDASTDAVDRLLDQCVRDRGVMPLMVVGDRPGRAAFREHSRHAESIAAEAYRSRTRSTRLTDLAEEALALWQHEEQEHVVGQLDQAAALGQIAWGITSTWSAVANRQAEHLWVEHDFARPGRIVAGIDGVEVTSDPAEPGVIDDLMDALITRAHGLGVPVDVLDPGTLHRDEPIAARVTATGPARSDSNPGSHATDELIADRAASSLLATG